MTERTLTESTVAGLHVGEWPGSGGTVLGLPGLNSTYPVWHSVAERLPDIHFVAPDLRGRGGSWERGGPYGLAQHARDLAQLAEELDLRDIVIVGHSMGAFLAPVAARALGDRVSRLILVDGGIPPKFPFWMRKPIVKTMFSLATRRLDRDWPSPEAYAKAALMKSVAFRPDLRDDLVEWLAYDLGEGTRPRFAREALVTDAVDTFFGDEVEPALAQLRVPAHLLYATAGKDDKAKPFYREDVVADWQSRVSSLTAEQVRANHVTIVFAPEVVQAIRG